MYDALKLLQTYDTVISVAVVAGAIIVLLCMPRTERWEWLDFIPKRRGKMLRKDRRKYVHIQATDGFVDFVEEQVAKGTFTREEAKELYRELKKCFPIRDLFPSPRLLKEAIQKRIQAHLHDPVNLPDKRPKKRHAFDKSA